MSLIILGDTAPTLLLNHNPKRRKLQIQMQPTDIDAGNTGNIRITFGHQPSTLAGGPAQGEALLQGSSIDQPSSSLPLDDRYKQSVLAISSQATQSITVQEETE